MLFNVKMKCLGVTVKNVDDKLERNIHLYFCIGLSYFKIFKIC